MPLPQPQVVLETGMGIGRVTDFLDLESCFFLGFEHDPQWRSPSAIPDRKTPTADEMASADLVILDSEPGWRATELALWADCGKPGSVCIVHDCGNGHTAGSVQHAVRRAVDAIDIHGIYLSNPRGGWIGQHP